MNDVSPNLINFFLTSQGIFAIAGIVLVIAMVGVIIYLIKSISKLNKDIQRIESRIDKTIQMGEDVLDETKEVTKKIGKSVLSYMVLKTGKMLRGKKHDKDE